MNHNDQTLALHAGHNTTKTEGTRAVPIYQTTSYVFDNTDHAANLFSLAEPGYIYTRLNNPTADILEQRLASLEGGIAAVATSSGSAALATTLLTLLKTGDHIVASNSLNGGTYNLLNVTLPRYGITTTFVDPDDTENFSKAINENTRVVYIESIGNPKLDVLDIESISKIAKESKLPLIVDNTVATPYLLKPINYGADIVIHSTTKYITGNGTSIGGVIIDAGNFDWSSGLFDEFTTPSAGYHGLVYHEALGPAAFIAKVRIEGLRDLGSAPSPFNCFQTIQGLETLSIRIKKHSENALKVAEWLENQDKVEWVNYPGLKSSKYFDLSKKYLKNGQSGIVTFGLKGGFDSAKKLTDKHGFFSQSSIPEGTYEGVKSTSTVAVGAQWFTSAKEDDDLIYNITKALWNTESRKLMDVGHSKGKTITTDTALAGVGVPLHPGAERFYKEAGLIK